jgi:hypothetical protein
MKDPNNHTPESSSSTHSKVTTGVASISSPLTHPWWIYRANQMKMSNNNGTQLPAHIDPLPDEPSSDSGDLR